ncbi:MAG: 50S ribosomal protein L3 [Myxococcota bacterium]|jgi:large subunit ribosomal protein L3|nr:50S ribosomal protein L3 [Myxococcota bacterium]
MAKGLIGRKIGMTEIFEADGTRVPVSVIKAGPCVVVRKKIVDGKDGYAALLLGFEDVRSAEVDGETHYKLSRPRLGLFEKTGLKPKRHLREMRLPKADVEGVEVGATLDASLFLKGELVDVIGTSKGRGFAGVIKRHNFAGSHNLTHGTHEYMRHGGSVSSNTNPGRIFKGKKMPGHYGNARCTVQNLRVAGVDVEHGLVLIKGGIPGPVGGLVVIRDAIKRRRTVRK